ncbi:MAG: neutral/alkaline non-lysosomal ceramidase N-terminal domain-containing protein [Jatrophihabitans sp.]
MSDNPLAALADDVPERVVLDVFPPKEQSLPPVAGLLAGAAEVDITPPPGMPKAGHSSNAHSGNGFRTRLHAHVLHLRAGTTSIAIVQCDLLAGSAVVAHLVAQSIAQDTDVRLSGLLLGATHTHAGPGQFHGNEAMNRFASNHPGFDPAWTGWLVDRLAGAVREAVATRRPARLATGATEVWGLTRNRSVESWVRNENVADKTLPPQRKYEAINPWLHLIRVDAIEPDGGYGPLGAAVIFSIHGTGVSQRDHSYNADVWAYLKGELGAHIARSTGRRAVVGAIEGTHGDVAPAVRPGLLVYPEAERVGRGIGAAAAELYDRLESDLNDDVTLAVGLRDIDLGTRPVIDGITLPPPAFGAATMAGARENQTPVIHRVPPFRAGHPKPGARGPHGAKWIPGGRRLHDLFVPPSSFPSVLPVQVLRVGATLIVALPFETTVESGRRVEAAVRAAIGPARGIERIAVSSLANEQFCYLTTPEEYSLQRYEGGNTLFGPQSQPFAAACAAALARDVLERGTVADHLGARRFDFAAHRYLAQPDSTSHVRVPAGSPGFVDPTATEDGYWEFRWYDRSPGSLFWHEPIAWVESRDDDGGWSRAYSGGVVLDDQGYHLGVVHLGADRHGRHRYAARWFTPYLGPGRSHRIVVAGRDARLLASTPLR